MNSTLKWCVTTWITTIVVCFALTSLLSSFSANFAATSWSLALLLILLLLGTVIFLEARRGGRGSIPAVLIFSYLTLLYVARPFYILLYGQLGTHQIGYWNDPDGASVTQWQVLFALIALLFGYYLVPGHGALSKVVVSKMRSGPISRSVLLVGAIVSFTCVVLILPQIISFPGGWRVALTLRQELYAGRTFIVYGLGAFNVAWLIFFAKVIDSRTQRQHALVLSVSYPVAAGLVLVSGSRSELITRSILPVTVLLWMSIRGTSKRIAILLVGIIGATALFTGYRAVVRDSGDSPDSEDAPSLSGRPGTSVGEFLEGDEASAFDYLAAIRLAVPSSVDFRSIETVEAVVSAPLPSNILPDKTVRGGEFVTQTLRPDLYRRGGNLAISAFGDLYLSGGLLVLASGAFLLGGLVGVSINRSRVEMSAFSVYVNLFLVACLIPIFRADLTELPVGVVRVIILVAFLRIASGSGSGSGSGSSNSQNVAMVTEARL